MRIGLLNVNKKYVRLIDFDGSRRNNFTVIRILFAWLVLYGHSFAIEKNHGIIDPLTIIFQGSTWIGAIAVNGFFMISGFLVTASLVRRGFVEYFISRSLRIYPALIICVFVSVFVIGPLSTDLHVVEYLSTLATYKYLANALAFLRMQWCLPGVFENNVRTAVNGSLWTLTVEVRCYLLLAVIGLVGTFRKNAVSNLVILGLFICGILLYKEMPLIGINEKWSRLALYFLIGIVIYVNRSHIIIDMRIAVFCFLLMYLSFGKPWFVYTFPLAFSYFVLFLAYGIHYLNIDKYIGDISYGMYIYAWPIQQSVAKWFPSLGPAGNILLSSMVVSGIAYLSWHYVERPALMSKPQLKGSKSRG